MSPNPYQYAGYNCAELPSSRGGVLMPRNVTQRQFPPTMFNGCLDSEKATWEDIQRCGGLMSICPGQKYVDPPWVKMPSQGKRFSQIGSIPLPTSDYGVDQLVTSFRVPLGYDGCIVSIVQSYTGQGFQDGSGDLTWRIFLNQRPVKNYGNTEVQIGSLITPYNVNSGQIILLSNQYVQYYVNVAASAAGNLNGGRIVCALFGWWWPR
jgi:hypothetical protein